MLAHSHQKDASSFHNSKRSAHLVEKHALRQAFTVTKVNKCNVYYTPLKC